MPTPTLSICVCTRDRPEELERLLRSIAAGSAMPDVVYVSDDSAQPDATRLLCERYSFVAYGTGPRTGLCANRNAVIARAETDFVSLIDDDGIILPDFVACLRSLLPGEDRRTLLTGDALENGERRSPKNPSFWGFFQKTPQDVWKTINLNCNCLPRSAFREAQFDERLKYGYEDMDLCSNLLSKGYRIRYVSILLAEHAPPARAAEVNALRFQQTSQARFITSMMRYMVWERKPLFAFLYLALAPLHRALNDLRSGRKSDLPNIGPDIIMATRFALSSRGRTRASATETA